jgi:small GTP-binding protein
MPLFKRTKPKEEEEAKKPKREDKPKEGQAEPKERQGLREKAGAKAAAREEAKEPPTEEPAPSTPPPTPPPTPPSPPPEQSPLTVDEELKALEDEVLGKPDDAAAGAEEEGEAGEDEGDEGDEADLDALLKETAHRPGEAPPAVDRDHDLDDIAAEGQQHLVKMARKVVLIGDPAVGKTSLIKKYVQDVFDDSYLNTIGAKVMKKNVGVKHAKTGEIVDLKLILWDIAGQETFSTVKRAYYKGASGAVVVCDVTRRETMEHMHKWIENLFDVSGVIPVYILVNKIDLEKEVAFTVEDVKKEFSPYEAPVYTSSAKTGHNVELVFHELGKSITVQGESPDAKEH